MNSSPQGESRHVPDHEAPARPGEDAASFAHDLNNVLTVIQGYVETLLDTVGDASPLRDDLDAIHRAAQRGSSLVRRLEAGNGPPGN